MTQPTLLKIAFILFVFCAATAIVSPAQVLTTLYSFCSLSNCNDGNTPYAGLVQASDGNFYGTTALGGVLGDGTVFKITPRGTLTILYSFCSPSGNCADGEQPYAGLVQASDGNLYGTTLNGGYSGNNTNCWNESCGTVFKITPGGTLTTLYKFCPGNCSDGANPSAALVQGSDGNFYGTTYFGGVYNQPENSCIWGCGTVFKITPSGTLTTLYTFCSGFCDDGASPSAALVQASNGNFYGTTSGSGTNIGPVSGTVFTITPSGTLATLYSFCSQPNCTDGSTPYGGLVQASDGNFYGTTLYGGANGDGTVFKITPSGALTTLYSFCSQNNCADGEEPLGLVQASDGNFYGTTYEGGMGCGRYGCGTLFKITPSGTLTTLYSFDGPDGANPEAALVQASDGNFYATASAGGAYSGGTVFEITPSGALTTLHSFGGSPNGGALPYAGVVQASDGTFYGTTFAGGANSDGTVFKISPANTVTTLHSFDGTDGNYPFDGLVQASDGNFYGTTEGGGASGAGTVFKITPSGTLTTLYSFCSQSGCADGSGPAAGLVQASDGNFYGTTSEGGANCAGCGTVFKITASGMLTTLYSFCSSQGRCSDGYNPYAGLVQASDGNFYGTTASGGTGGYYGAGTVFKITPNGTLTTLYSFCVGGPPCPDGGWPYAGLVQARDGNFYGTTSQAGAYGNYGTVFKITPSGTLTTLHSFNGTDGAVPSAGLVQASDGNFYGATSAGGAYNNCFDYPGCGTVFEMTPSGTLTTLHSFAGYPNDGATPSAGLVQARDGNFYGTTSAGGASNQGTIFRLVTMRACTVCPTVERR